MVLDTHMYVTTVICIVTLKCHLIYLFMCCGGDSVTIIIDYARSDFH